MSVTSAWLKTVTSSAARPRRWLKPSDYDALKPPSLTHLLGTDEAGRDILSRIIYGTRISLRVGLIAVGIGSLIGVTLGLIAGFYGQITDSVILRLMDIWLAFPGILLALAIITVLGPSLFNVMIAVGLSAVPTYVRVTRGSVMSVRQMEYVLSARAVGSPNRTIMVRHILPNILPSLIVLSALGIATAILAAAALSFIGLGAQPPTPEWGAMLTVGRQFMRQAWWVTTFPGLAIMITVLGIIAALNHNTWIDSLTMVTALGGVSIPNFWLGLMLILIFAVNLSWK